MSTKDQDKEMKKAIEIYEKAQKMIAKEKFDKAAKEFKKAYEKFTKIGALNQAENVAKLLVESSLIEKRYNTASDALIEAANISLLQNRLSSAFQHYKSALNFMVEDPKINKPKISAEISCLAAFIHVLKGKFQDGIDFFKKQIEVNKYKGISEIPLISYSESMFNALISKQAKYQDEAKDKMQKLQLRDGEKILITKCVELIDIYINSKLKYTVNTELLPAGQDLHLKVNPVSNKNVKIIDSTLNYDTQHFELIDDAEITENEAIFHFKTKLSGKGNIGPLSFQVKTEDGFEFPLIFKKEFEVLPGKGNITINLRDPFEIIQAEKTDLEFEVKNEGKGEVTDIQLSIEIPEEILLVGGTKEKKVHAIPTNGSFVIKYLIQSLLQGEFQGKYRLSYNNGDEIIEKENDFKIISR